MTEILEKFVENYIDTARTFGLNFTKADLNKKDLKSLSHIVFEIPYFGHATGFFRAVLSQESLDIYKSVFDDRSCEKVFSLFNEIMNLTISSTLNDFPEFEHCTIGLPRSFYAPVHEPELVISEASIFDENTKTEISIFLHQDFRKTDLSIALEKQRRETTKIFLKAEKLQDANQSLDSQKFEAIGQLAAGVAHEINTPIQFVSDNINFLSDAFAKFIALSENMEHKDIEYYKEEIPAALEESKEGILRIANIVKSLKEFSHPGNDQVQLYPIKNLIENCVSLTRNEWKYVADIKTDIEDVKVKIYPSELSQVFVNMIVNSANSIQEKFANKKEGLITIRSIKSGDGFTIELEDNGTGIPQKNVDQVFNPFFTTKEIGKGTGQGLAISKKIIEEKHKGSIEITRNSEEGLCFRIALEGAENDW